MYCSGKFSSHLFRFPRHAPAKGMGLKPSGYYKGFAGTCGGIFDSQRSREMTQISDETHIGERILRTNVPGPSERLQKRQRVQIAADVWPSLETLVVVGSRDVRRR